MKRCGHGLPFPTWTFAELQQNRLQISIKSVARRAAPLSHHCCTQQTTPDDSRARISKHAGQNIDMETEAGSERVERYGRRDASILN